MRQRTKQHIYGFTFMEMVVMLCIVAIMVSVAIPTIGNMVNDAKVRTSEREMLELVKAIVGDPDIGILGYRAEVGALPTTVTDLHTYNAVVASPYNPFTRTGWNGPYVDLTRKDADGDGLIGNNEYEVAFDPWGRAYQYDNVAGTFTSWGPDRAAAGGDDIIIEIE